MLDALGAMSTFMLRGGKDPLMVWRYVASGAFGNEALKGGSAPVVWGLGFHFVIALTFAAFFYLIYPSLRRLISNPILTGLLYGVFVWVVMNLLVLPLSQVAPPVFEISRVLIGLSVLMLCVGLPIALIVNRYRGF
ncbi:hypothetical protein GCM10028773_16280 [Spirosoma koreense]